LQSKPLNQIRQLLTDSLNLFAEQRLLIRKLSDQINLDELLLSEEGTAHSTTHKPEFTDLRRLGNALKELTNETIITDRAYTSQLSQ